MENKLMVSVDMITYNHEAYIAQAIEGVLMQETNFDYELIIADDCSPDNCEEIIRNIIATHPKGHLIKYHRHEKNIGMTANGIYALKQCSGKYIAICEGDDYWIDPLKLQKQVDFLEKNIDVSLCFNPSAFIVEGAVLNPQSMYSGLREGVYSGAEILENWIIPTASVMFRSIVLKKVLYDRLSNKNYIYGDIILFLSLAEFGKLYCINQIMTVYRRHSGGVTQEDTSIANHIKIYKHREAIANDFNNKYSYLKKKELSKCYFSLGLNFLKHKRIAGFIYLIKGIYFNPNVFEDYFLNKIKK